MPQTAALGRREQTRGAGMMSVLGMAAQGQVASFADTVTLQQVVFVAQAFFAIVAGLVAFLGVPLALRQLFNLRHELRRYDSDYLRRRDAEANLNISADFSISSASHPTSPASTDGADLDPAASAVRKQPGIEVKSPVSAQPSPAAEPGKRVLRMDLTLENVGEGTVDVLGCLVAARELEQQGEGVISGGRDAQWDDLTTHYWDAADDTLSPGLSTTKHTVYAQDALARVKARSHKTLARIDQVREYPNSPDVYLLYRVFVVARRSTRTPDNVRDWMALQRALLNVNAPAFRAAAREHNPWATPRRPTAGASSCTITRASPTPNCRCCARRLTARSRRCATQGNAPGPSRGTPRSCTPTPRRTCCPPGGTSARTTTAWCRAPTASPRCCVRAASALASGR